MKVFMITLFTLILYMVVNKEVAAQHFAPLNLDNVWVWDHVEWGTIEKSTLVDTNYLFNNNIYSKIRLYESSDIYIYSRHNENDSIYYLYRANYPYNNGDVPYYKLNCVVGDTFSYPMGASTSVIAVTEAYETPVFDTMLTVKILHVNHGGLVEYYQAWTDEIGLLGIIDIPWGNISFILRGCIINGRAYGDTSYTVGVEDDPFITHNFKLFQNYPNPFNPVTTIDYELQEYSYVKLKVYDILGNEVAVLVDEEKYAGKYSIKFDGKNLTSGVYFYKLTIGGNTQVRKMILLQ